MNAIELNNVNKSFGDFAISDLTFSLPEGTICGLAGENGAGKSTTLRLLMGALRPDSGEIRVLGKSPADPSFASVKAQIGVVLEDTFFPACLDAVVMGKVLSKTYPTWDQAYYEELIRRFDLPEKKTFKDYSRGMRMKLGVAAALSHHPRLLVLDEPVSALDVSVQSQVLNLLLTLQQELNLAYLFISHDLSVVRHISDRVAVMYMGKIVEMADADRLYDHPCHAYTRALLSAIPIPDPEVEEKKERIKLDGELPSPIDPPAGCRFKGRCKHATEICGRERPELREIETGHYVACHMVK